MRIFKKLFRKRYILIFVILLIASGAVLKFTVFANQDAPTTTNVQKGELVEELMLSGKIDSEEKVTLQFQTGGLLSYVGVKEGDKIEKYTTIASLDQRTAEKNLQDELIDYSTQRLTFDQTKEDYQGRAAEQAVNDRMKRVLQDNQYDLEKAVVSVELKSLAKELSVLNTPISGIVTRVDTPYSGVNIYLPSQAQFEVVNPTSVYFNVTADQTEVVNLKEGMTGTVVLDSYPDETIKATVKNISFTPRSGETETVYEVKVELSKTDNANYKYKLGMTGDITFQTQKIQSTLFLPSKYIKNDDSGKYVLLGEKKEKRYIKTGMETDLNIEIKSGLKENDLIYD